MTTVIKEGTLSPRLTIAINKQKLYRTLVNKIFFTSSLTNDNKVHRLKACLVALQTIAYKMIKPKLTMLNDYAIEIICLHYFLKLNRFEFKKNLV